MIKYLYLSIIFFLLLPFLLNFYIGFLKPPKDSVIYKINCDTLSNDLYPYIEKIIYTTKLNGSKIDTKTNLSHGKGYKIIREEIKKQLPEVCNLIDKNVYELVNQAKYVSQKNINLANCVNEKYCWFIRVYNEENDFLDWHFDNNFTKGLRFTMVNTIFVSDCNTSHFMLKDSKNKTHIIKSNNGEGLLYNGSDVKHAISEQTNKCIRIVLVIPLYETEEYTLLGKYRKMARDFSYKLLNL